MTLIDDAPKNARPSTRSVLFSIAAIVMIAVLIVLQATQWRQFQWREFWAYAKSVSVTRVLIAVAAIYCAYAVRAIRWRVLAGITHTPVLHLLSPTIVGFTATAMLGRAGELVRPWLISSREKLSFESQMLVWVVERLFDTATAVVLIGAALILTSARIPYIEAFRVVGVAAIVFVVAGAALIGWFAVHDETGAAPESKSRALRFIAARAHHIASAARTLASPAPLLSATGLSVLMWMLIASAYFAVLHSFTAEAAHLGTVQVLVLMGFSLAGSLIPLPAAGGQQLAVVAALVAVFGLPSDLAVSCGILLWLATWMSIVPVGLVLLRGEGLTLRSLVRMRAKSGG
jgi:uncharacterized membrane protein YbhN (UPF0104 family)